MGGWHRQCLGISKLRGESLVSWSGLGQSTEHTPLIIPQHPNSEAGGWGRTLDGGYTRAGCGARVAMGRLAMVKNCRSNTESLCLSAGSCACSRLSSSPKTAKLKPKRGKKVRRTKYS